MSDDNPKPDLSPEEEKKLALQKRAEYTKQYVLKNKEYIDAYQKEYAKVIEGETAEERDRRIDMVRRRKKFKPPAEEEPEEVKAARIAAKKAEKREYDKEYRAKNAARLEEIHKKWREENEEKIRAKSKLKREKIKADPVLRKAKNDYSRTWYAARKPEQKESLTKWRSGYQRWRYENDLTYKLLTNFRTRANGLFNFACRHNKPRKNSFERYFCCEFDALKAHISSLFRDGMTWENHGKIWHLDHIVPLFLGRGDFELYRRLNHYKNLQPLLIVENLVKGDSIPEIWPEGVPFTREEVMASYEKYISEKPKAPPKAAKKKGRKPKAPLVGESLSETAA